MKEFSGKIAVVTGGASGIGRSMAERFAEEGMKIVLADIEPNALDAARDEMAAEGADVIAVQADVSDYAQVENLARTAEDKFGTVHIICNNAGVGVSGDSWEISVSDWEWVMGVNLWGVIYGVKAFVPIMLKNGESGHVINTSSMAGVTTGAGMAPYNVSKHGVVALSEALYHELQRAGSKIGVSVVCPGWVDTKINESDRNRPAGRVTDEELDEASKQFRTQVAAALRKGLPPEEVANLVHESVVNDRFYVFPHPHWKNMIQARFEAMMKDKAPTIVPPPDL